MLFSRWLWYKVISIDESNVKVATIHLKQTDGLLPHVNSDERWSGMIQRLLSNDREYEDSFLHGNF